MFDSGRMRKTTSLLAVGAGLFAALLPRLNVRLFLRGLANQFDNTDALEPTDAYLRQVRATGIGMAAAGIAGYAMETVAQKRAQEESEEFDSETTADDAA